MELLLLIGVLVTVVIIHINVVRLSKKIDDVYTEVAEVHNKMGGWDDI